MLLWTLWYFLGHYRRAHTQQPTTSPSPSFPCGYLFACYLALLAFFRSPLPPHTIIFFDKSGFSRCSATGLLFEFLTTRVNLGAVEAGRARMGVGGVRHPPLLATTVLSMSVLIPGRK